MVEYSTRPVVEISTTSGRIQYTTSGRIFHDQWSNTVHDQWSKFARPVVDFITTSGRICYDHWSTFLRPVVEYSTRLIWHVLGSRLPVTINRPVTTTGRTFTTICPTCTTYRLEISTSGRAVVTSCKDLHAVRMASRPVVVGLRDQRSHMVPTCHDHWSYDHWSL